MGLDDTGVSQPGYSPPSFLSIDNSQRFKVKKFFDPSVSDSPKNIKNERINDLDGSALAHADFSQSAFWRKIPEFSNIDPELFQSYSWQLRKSLGSFKQLEKAIRDIVSSDVLSDIQQGLSKAPMSLRITPYILSLIDWDDPKNCPIRKQFVAFGSDMLIDHPKLNFDSLGEQDDSPVPGVIHRYHDKALFLPLDTCPVYCRFCTRSYAVGSDTETLNKIPLGRDVERWEKCFEYIRSVPYLEDIVISGGDTFNLLPKQIRHIGLTLLSIPHVRRIRFATKGIAVMPQKILTHLEWVDAVTEVSEQGRKLNKEVVIHTHFNHPNEITWFTKKAADLLFQRSIKVRCQSVLQRGVNDDPQVLERLVKRLSYINIQPYYIYQCDMVKGVEELRTSIHKACDLEKELRGQTAGFNTPTFVCDAPGGGGKRDIHSYEWYDKKSGISVYRAPSVKKDKKFLYFDPLHSLDIEYQEKWQVPKEKDLMINNALKQSS